MTIVQLAPGFAATHPPRLTVVAAAVDDDATTPAGVHLRWFDPRSLPRPVRYEVHRFDDVAWRRIVAEAGTTVPVSLDGDGGVGWSGLNRMWDLDGAALLVLATVRSRQFLLRLAQPAVAVELRFAGRQDGPVRAFHRSHPLFATSLRRSPLLEGPGITDLLVGADVAALRRLHITFEADLIGRLGERGAARPALVLKTPTTVDEAYGLVREDLDRGLRNRFFDGAPEDFRDRYPPRRIADLVEVVAEQLLDASPRRPVAAQHGMAAGEVDAASFVALAGLDPNVARLTASYVVDHGADPGRDWRHVLVGHLVAGGRKFLAGYSRTSGRTDPPVLGPVRAEQLPGISYEDGTPYGRVGVFVEGGRREGAAPVTLVDVDRLDRGARTPLTATQPALWSARGRPVMVDAPRRVGSVDAYLLRPVDLFGRIGSAVRTGEVKVADLAAPVPPVGLSVQLEQDGFPWTDPADLDGDGERRLRGRLTASFRYGVGPSTASPDATAVELRWWPGPADTRPTDFSQWRPLTTVALRPAVTGTVLLGPASTVGRVVLPVARIDSHERAATTAPGVAAPGDAAEIALSPRRLELLVDRALLEPNLFAGYRCALDGQEYQVATSTAGIAFADDDTVDKRRTARLLVEDHTAAPSPGMAELRLPAVAGLTVASLHAALENPDVAPDALAHHGLVVDASFTGALAGVVVGGELAVDLPFRLEDGRWTPLAAAADSDARTGTVVGRVVGEVVPSGDLPDARWRVLVRVRPRDLVLLLLTAHTAAGARGARLHAPYVAGPLGIGIGIDADVRVDLPDGDRFATVAVAAAAEDRGGRRGPMAGPAEGRVVRPPPPPPPPPYPRDEGAEATAGIAGIPDVRRQSRVALSWIREPGLRYEVSRALDSSILAADRSAWEQGGHPHHRPLPATVMAVGGAGGDALVITVRGSELVEALLDAGTVLAGAVERAVVTAAAGVGSDTWDLTIHPSDPAAWAADADVVVHPLGIVTGPVLLADVTGSHVQPNGMLRIDLALDGAAQLEALRGAQGGRISVVHVGSPDRVAHRLVAVREHAGVPYALCRAHSDLKSLAAVHPGTPAQVEPAPDDTAVRTSPAALRRLADVRDDAGRPVLDAAFGIVTGVPLTAEEADVFADIVPGPGRSRYLYRVRAVAASGAASAWSRPSVAFSQFPPRPEPPAAVAWRRADDLVLLSWQRSLEPADAIEVAAVEPDGRRSLVGSFEGDAIVEAPRFPPSPVILFDFPIDVADHGEGMGVPPTDLEVATPEDGPLAGRFVGRTEAGAEGSSVLRLSGFRCADAVPLRDHVLVTRGDTLLQTVRLVDGDRRAVLLDASDVAGDSNGGGPRRLEVRAVSRHGGLGLRSRPVEVVLDA